jgi:hypothetical protein
MLPGDQHLVLKRQTDVFVDSLAYNAHRSESLDPLPYTLRPTPQTLDPLPCTLRLDPLPYTLRPTPQTLHLNPRTPDPEH